MVQSALNGLPYSQSNLASDITLAKAGFGAALGYDNSPPMLLAQASKPVPAVSPLPVVKPSVKGRWIIDAKSGKKVFVSNLPDGRVRIEVAKNKAYYEIATSDSYIRRTLADPTSVLAKNATYRMDEPTKSNKPANNKKNLKNIKIKSTSQIADIYNADRSYTPPGMDPNDRFIGYAGIDIFDLKKPMVTRYQMMIGCSKKGRGFYIVDAKKLKTNLPNAKSDTEAFNYARSKILKNDTSFTPMQSYIAVEKAKETVAAADVQPTIGFRDLLPDIYAVGVVFKMPKFVEELRKKLPDRLKSFLPRGQGLWALLPNGSNALTQPTIFSSTPFVPFNLTRDKLNRLGLGSVFTWNPSKGTLEGGVGGTARLELHGGHNMVFWINGRSNRLVINPPATGEFTRSVNIGIALGLAKPAANILDKIADRTTTLAMIEAAAGAVPTPATPVVEGAALTTATAATAQRTIAMGLHVAANTGGIDVYTGVGIRVEAKWMDGKFLGLFKGGHLITVAAVQKMMERAQKSTIGLF